MSTIDHSSQTVKHLIEQTVKRLYSAQKSIESISDVTGLSIREVKHIAHKLGLIVRQQYRVTDEEIQSVKSCVAAQLGGQEIADKTGMPLQRVQYIAYEKLGISIAGKRVRESKQPMDRQQIYYTAPKPFSGQLIPNYETETIELAK